MRLQLKLAEAPAVESNVPFSRHPTRKRLRQISLFNFRSSSFFKQPKVSRILTSLIHTSCDGEGTISTRAGQISSHVKINSPVEANPSM
jgi:hypothetical protein